jgi:hypothetical protein
MSRPSHSSLFEQPNNIWWGVLVTKLHIMQFSPFRCYLVLLGSKFWCSPQVKNRGLFTLDKIKHLPSRRSEKRHEKGDDRLQGFLAKGRILDSPSTHYEL